MPPEPNSTLNDGNQGGNQGGAQPWFGGFDDDTKAWVTARGYDKMDAAAVLPELVKGYRGAESKLGVPADQVLRLPGEKATPDEIKAFRTKLGVPEKIEDYGLKPPEGHDDAFLKVATGWFHKHGVPKATAAALAQEWNEYVNGAQTGQLEAWNKRFDEELTALKGEWKGDDFAKNSDLAKRVMRAGGWTGEQLEAMERALGPKAFLQGFAKFGAMVGEHRFVTGDSKQQFGMSPEQAKQRITDLQNDKAWAAKYLSGDADAKAEFTRLQQIANPEQLAA